MVIYSQEDMDRLNNKIRFLEAEISNQKFERGNIDLELENLKAKLAKGVELMEKGEVTILSEENPVLVEEIENLRADLKNKSHFLDECQTKAEELQRNNESQAACINEMGKEIDHLKAEETETNESLLTELKNMTNARNHLAAKLGGRLPKERTDELLRDIEDLTKRGSEIIQKNNVLETKVLQLSEELEATADYKEKYHAMRNDLTELKKRHPA